MPMMTNHQPSPAAPEPPQDAVPLKTRGAMAWMEAYEKANPGAFAHYWRTVLHGRTDRESDELATAFWAPIAALDGIRLTSHVWRSYRSKHDLVEFTKPTLRAKRSTPPEPEPEVEEPTALGVETLAGLATLDVRWRTYGNRVRLEWDGETLLCLEVYPQALKRLQLRLSL